MASMRRLCAPCRLLPARVPFVLILSLVLSACGGDGGSGRADAGPDGPPALAPVAVFEPPATPGAGQAWGKLPFPSDLYLDSSGRLKLTSAPLGPNGDPTFAAQLLEALSDLDGAGAWSNVYFPIEGDIDPASLEGNVAVVEIGPAGLRPVPADLLWRPDLKAIIAAPKLGFVFRPGSVYGAYVTSDVKSPDGKALTADAGFSASHVGALLSALDPAIAGKVVSATVFRIADLAGETKAMRDIVAQDPPTFLSVDRIYTATSSPLNLDQLFGTPDASRPWPGHSITDPARGQPHDHIEAVVNGTLQLTSFISDDPKVGGVVELDGTGKPRVKGRHPIKFTLVVPKPNGGTWAQTPVVIYMHGVRRTRIEALVVGDILAAKGIATLAIDVPFHGDRYPNATDNYSALTEPQTGDGDGPTPDGFGDPQGDLSPALFFDLSMGGRPRVMRDTLRQAAVDIASLVAFIKRDPSSYAALTAALDAIGPNDFSFRRDRIVLVTHSFGTIFGGMAAAVEPGIDAVILDVSTGGFPFPTGFYSAIFSDLFRQVVLVPFDIESRIVLGDAQKDIRFEPFTVLWNYALAKGDNISYAPLTVDGTLRSSPPHILVTHVWSDEYVPNQATEHVAGALGLPRMEIGGNASPPGGEFTRYVSLPTRGAPLSGNLDGGEATGALLSWHPATHGLHYYYDDQLNFEPGFPVPTPPHFIPLPSPIPIANPTCYVLHLFAELAADVFDGGGPPTIADPYDDPAIVTACTPR